MLACTGAVRKNVRSRTTTDLETHYRDTPRPRRPTDVTRPANPDRCARFYHCFHSERPPNYASAICPPYRGGIWRHVEENQTQGDISSTNDEPREGRVVSSSFFHSRGTLL